jgi:GTP-binding protein YchF
MSKKCGIIGLPNVGKSLLFNKLTKTNKAQSENYPFCTIDPNIGFLTYEDDKLKALANFGKSRKTIYSYIELYDIAGLVKNASKGEGLGNQFLANIRSVNAIIHVTRGFADDDVIHVMDRVDPINDYYVIQLELIEADIKHIDNKIPKTKSAADVKELEGLKSLLLETVNSSEETFDFSMHKQHQDAILSISTKFGLDLLSMKPQVVLINGNNDEMNEFCEKNHISHVSINISTINQDEINAICEAIYEKLNLICFFTTGEVETRAWMIKNGSNAREASGEIHSDFPKKFIKAKVTAYDLYKTQTPKTTMEKGDYIIQNRDIIEFAIGK